MTDFPVLGPTGSKTLTVTAGRPLFIVGRNGTGKSALVHNISQNGGARTVYLPGNRTSIFDGEGLSLTSANRKNLSGNMRSWDSSPDTSGLIETKES